jgi:hypothetical protein
MRRGPQPALDRSGETLSYVVAGEAHVDRRHGISP